MGLTDKQIRTISVCFANESYVDIAKVEGSVAYKQMMRAQNWTTADDSINGGWISSTAIFDHEQPPQGIVNQISLRDRLPCWLGGLACDGAVQQLVPMLRTLQVAASSYLGTEAEEVIVVFPARPSDHLVRDLVRASTRSSLRLLIRLETPAGHLAAYANGMSDRGCYIDGERRILAVEYSRAALTSMLLQEECGMYEDIRGSHITALGADHWSSDVESDMVSELRRVARNENAPETVNLGFDELVLLGELGDDKRVMRALHEAFVGSQEVNAVTDSSEMVSPLFAAARGAALLVIRGDFAGSEFSQGGGSWFRFGSRELR